mmetsp:Transcript_1659/g.4148  ORF Transcript_1659/g.4148 Transcript_1659/m.4148 type:complete len:360 (-) Transcript_1659:33-1112(-)
MKPRLPPQAAPKAPRMYSSYGWLAAASLLAAFPLFVGLSRTGQLSGMRGLGREGMQSGESGAHYRGAAGEWISLQPAPEPSPPVRGGAPAQGGSAPVDQPVALPAKPAALPEPPAMCDLAWRPGLAAFAPRGAAQLAAWLSAELGSPGLARLERFFEKLHRGERVTVYFLGDSVTRGSGAGHHCATCSGRPTDLHPWLNASSGPAGEGCTGFNASATRGGDTYAHCARVGSNRLHECRGSGPDASEAHTSPNSTAAELGEAALWCYPRNSWRCLVVHWLQHAWPGQVKVVISSKPLLFMAACFGRALGGTDLILHEQAVNGGGRMLCLQERILHAALARPDLAVGCCHYCPLFIVVVID